MVSQNTQQQAVCCDSNAEQLRQGCHHCLGQCAQLLAELSSEDYARDSEVSSIGAHVRHILDRFQSFLLGLTDAAIDYDARKRDRTLECNKEAAEFALGTVARRIDEISLEDLTRSSLTITESVHPQLDAVSADSTVERELVSLISHSTHHLAIIAMLARPLGYQLGEDFGKAPSTIAHERT